MKRLRRATLLRSFATGVLSGGVCALAEFLTTKYLYDGVDPSWSREDIEYGQWAIIGGVGVLSTALELYCLFYDIAGTAAQQTVVAGMSLCPPDHGVKFFLAMVRVGVGDGIYELSSVDPTLSLMVLFLSSFQCLLRT